MGPSRSGAALLVALPLWALLACPAAAADHRRWTTTNTALELSLASGLLVDTMQTIHFLRQGEEEMNPILGRRPSVRALLVYDVVALGLHAAVAYALPEPYRTMWQCVWVGAELGQVGSNAGVHGGLHVTLPWDW
jgi:hypothetical protein